MSREATKQLFQAAEAGDYARALNALAAGADVNGRDEWRNTPLHWAAHHGNVGVAQLLIDRGADITAKEDCHGRTPLEYALATLRRAQDAARQQATHADRLTERRDADEKRQR